MDNKKLLLLSDTHGEIASLKAVLSWAKERMPPNDSICCAAFLGDGISDLRPATDAAGFSCEWRFVSGNNDYGSLIPGAAILEFGDHRFFMCHGHRYSLYGGYHKLVAAAKNAEAEAVLFGHTHVPLMTNMDGVFLINPGSIGRPRAHIGATFAVIECAAGEPFKTGFWGIGPKRRILALKQENL